MSEPAEEPAGRAGRKMVKYERPMRSNFSSAKIGREPSANRDVDNVRTPHCHFFSEYNPQEF